jgi:hypothetical protein
MKLVKLKDNPLAEGIISVKKVEKTKGRNGTGGFPMKEVEIVVLQTMFGGLENCRIPFVNKGGYKRGCDVYLHEGV